MPTSYTRDALAQAVEEEKSRTPKVGVGKDGGVRRITDLLPIHCEDCGGDLWTHAYCEDFYNSCAEYQEDVGVRCHGYIRCATCLRNPMFDFPRNGPRWALRDLDDFERTVERMEAEYYEPSSSIDTAIREAGARSKATGKSVPVGSARTRREEELEYAMRILCEGILDGSISPPKWQADPSVSGLDRFMGFNVRIQEFTYGDGSKALNILLREDDQNGKALARTISQHELDRASMNALPDPF